MAGNFLSRDLNTAKGGGVETESDEVVGIEDYGQVRAVIEFTYIYIGYRLIRIRLTKCSQRIRFI